MSNAGESAAGNINPAADVFFYRLIHIFETAIKRDSITTYLAKVFFRLSHVGNPDNFQIIPRDSVVNTPPVYDYVGRWPSCRCVLHIERVWSTIVYSWYTFVRNVQREYTETALHLCFLGLSLWSRAQQYHRIVEKLEITTIYSTPKVKVLSFIPRDLIATSPLEDPEKGEEYDW